MNVPNVKVFVRHSPKMDEIHLSNFAEGSDEMKFTASKKLRLFDRLELRGGIRKMEGGILRKTVVQQSMIEAPWWRAASEQKDMD